MLSSIVRCCRPRTRRFRRARADRQADIAVRRVDLPGLSDRSADLPRACSSTGARPCVSDRWPGGMTAILVRNADGTGVTRRSSRENGVGGMALSPTDDARRSWFSDCDGRARGDRYQPTLDRDALAYATVPIRPCPASDRGRLRRPRSGSSTAVRQRRQRQTRCRRPGVRTRSTSPGRRPQVAERARSTSWTTTRRRRTCSCRRRQRHRDDRRCDGTLHTERHPHGARSWSHRRRIARAGGDLGAADRRSGSTADAVTSTQHARVSSDVAASRRRRDVAARTASSIFSFGTGQSAPTTPLIRMLSS